MRGTRGTAWADVRGGRDAPSAPKPSPDSQTKALIRLTTSEEWASLLVYLREREWAQSASDDVADASALARGAGRRSLLREIEALSERLRNGDGSNQY